ncbi:glycosyltransferase [Mycobacterium angelicum]|uniref:Erythromycin biosynthesis protein CIII-like C-terminal domain-containing protein n=1 Tax=Mycobacterium angelicum TaxID=470074 RepID=A0A1X0A8F9_MYCAN|nr:glycosyltransferase [Mycobacterium angelicum]MCV7197459.1 glycosyltransferase family 1 protein [Mycobacterium angelicum]ORA26357.1 hypothetical protein BST12_00270 [Mycobacterium angelicum]
MRVAIACLGSRGDALPLVEIARRLRDAGHEVAFGCNPDVASVVQRCGFDPIVYTSLDIKEFLSSEEGRRSFFEGGTVAQLRTLGGLYDRFSADVDSGLIALCRGADCVIVGRVLQEKVAIITAGTGTPVVSVHTFPCSPDAAVANPLVGPGPQRLRYPLSKLTYYLLDLGVDVSTLPNMRSLARRIGYPHRMLRPSTAFRRSDHLIVETFGTALVPLNKRADPACRRIGFIRPAAQHVSALSADLARWIGEDDKPLIYLGFGSMPVPELGRLIAEFDGICAVRGYRAVVATGWSAANPIAAQSNRIWLEPEVDHAALFPYCTALVHHGGAGTVATAAASGKPSVVCSHGFDQYFWGLTLRRLGVGELVPRPALSAGVIADAIELVRTAPVQRAAERLAARMHDDLDGADEFMSVLHEMMANRKRQATRAPSC